MDPTTPPENEVQLAFIELGAATVELFFTIVLEIFSTVATCVFSRIIEGIELVFGPLPI